MSRRRHQRRRVEEEDKGDNNKKKLGMLQCFGGNQSVLVSQLRDVSEVLADGFGKPADDLLNGLMQKRDGVQEISRASSLDHTARNHINHPRLAKKCARKNSAKQSTLITRKCFEKVTT